MHEVFKPRLEMINGVQHLIVAIPTQEPELSNSQKTYVMAKCPSPLKTGVKFEGSGEHHGKEITFSGSAWIKK